MEKTISVPKVNNSINENIFVYIIYLIFIIFALYTLYFLYSLATGNSIINDIIHQALFLCAGMITFFGVLIVQQVMLRN